MPDPVQKELIADLARELVAEIAPQELPLFRATSEAFLARLEKPTPDKSRTDAMLGFGVGPELAFVTPAVLVVAHEVIAFLASEVKKSLEKEASDVVSGLVKKMFKRAHSVDTKRDIDVPPLLTSKQATQIRELVFEKACQLNISEAQGRLLADAVVGTLVVASS